MQGGQSSVTEDDIVTQQSDYSSVASRVLQKMILLLSKETFVVWSVVRYRR